MENFQKSEDSKLRALKQLSCSRPRCKMKSGRWYGFSRTNKGKNEKQEEPLYDKNNLAIRVVDGRCPRVFL